MEEENTYQSKFPVKDTDLTGFQESQSSHSLPTVMARTTFRSTLGVNKGLVRLDYYA